MCYITEAGKSALGVFVMLDEAGISALGVRGFLSFQRPVSQIN